MFDLTNELAYLIGVYLTDGFVLYNKKFRTYQFRLKSIDADFIRKTQLCCKKVCGTSGSIRIRKDERLGKKQQEILIVCNKDLSGYLQSVTGDKKWIPVFMEDCSLDIFRSFASGVFDGDGFVGVQKGTYYSQLGISMNSEWLDRFAYLLQKRGVRIGKRQMKQISHLGNFPLIHYNFDIKSFLDNRFYFSIERKQKRLNDYKRFILDNKYKI